MKTTVEIQGYQAVFNENMHKLMCRRGWNWARLAEEAGVDGRTIWNILHGRMKHGPSIDTALRISQALGASLDYLFRDR